KGLWLSAGSFGAVRCRGQGRIRRAVRGGRARVAGNPGQQRRPRRPRAAKIYPDGEPRCTDAVHGAAVMHAWGFFNPVRIVCAPGACLRLGEHVHQERILLVTSAGFRRRGLVDRIAGVLGPRLAGVVDDVSPNPDVDGIDRQAAAVRAMAPDLIVGLGGGSSIDTAKALARLLPQPAGTTLAAHFRDGASLAAVSALPLAAIPTTAGTGAEVTPFGTVW